MPKGFWSSQVTVLMFGFIQKDIVTADTDNVWTHKDAKQDG